MTQPTPDVLAEVGRLLDRAGLRPGADEQAELAASYPIMRAGIDALHAVSEARYAEPSMVFRAGARVVDWTGQVADG